MATAHGLPATMAAVPTLFLFLTRPLLRKATALHTILRPILTLFVVLTLHGPLALADCECGYLSTINGTSNSHHALFTNLIETDFTRFLTPASLAQDPDWARQAFNLTRERARGEYGEMFAVENVVVGSQHEGHDGGHHDGQEGERGEGVQLLVRSGIVDGMVPVAELDTQRLDLFWGTFRASMRIARAGGTCAAFFWYFNDTQEIDMEFLTKDFNTANGSYPVNLVLQSREAAMAGYDAAKTGNFVKANLPFDPAGDFHEYRIDYLPGRVFFYADGAMLAEMDGPAVPSSPGHLILQHWSNGNKHWSGGPPAQDAALTVRYVKAYFNSSLAQRQEDWNARCRDPAAPNAICRIPDVKPGDSSAAEWFFTDHGKMTNNQTASEQSKSSRVERTWRSSIGWLLLLGGWAVALG